MLDLLVDVSAFRLIGQARSLFQHLVHLGHLVLRPVERLDVGGVEDGPQDIGIAVGEPQEANVVAVLVVRIARGGPLEWIDLQVDAHIAQARLDGLGHGLVARPRDDREIDFQALAALGPHAIGTGRPTTLVEQLLGFVRIEAVQALRRRIVGERGSHQRTPGHLIQPLEDGLVHTLAVDRVLHCLADHWIADGAGAGRVEQQHEARARLTAVDDDEPGVLAERAVLQWIQVVDDLSLA